MLTMRCWIPEPLTLRQYSIASRVLMPPCRRSIDRGSLDFLEPSADRIAMPAQHIEFPTQHGGIFKCIEITCVGILGHKGNVLFSPAPPIMIGGCGLEIGSGEQSVSANR